MKSCDEQRAIGVFDSGMGGLTVLRALQQRLPNESFVYLGDTARLPYGTKSQATVQQYAIQMTRILVERRIKALVIACNTATTAALTYLQETLPDIPVIGVVRPGAEAAIAATSNQRMVILATETTIASQAYQTFIQQQLPHAVIHARACSLLVALAEEGIADHRIAEETLRYYLADFSNQDTVLLGCTHFPVFKPLLKRLLPDTVQIVDSSEATAVVLEQVLRQHNAFAIGTPARETRYLVTDSVRRFQTIGEIFLGIPLALEQLELVDIRS